MSESFEEKQEHWLADESNADYQAGFDDEVLNDSALADEAYTALELDDALREAAACVASRKIARRSITPTSWSWAAGLVAAVLALVMFLPQEKGDDGDFPLRLRGAGDAGAAVCISPADTLKYFPTQFVWHQERIAPDSRFRWELYDDQAKRRGVAVVADSVFVRKASETPADSLGTWRWLVVELKSDGREGPTSAAVEFTVKKKDVR